MKKILAITMLLVVTLCCAFAFTACGSDAKLAMNKLYIRSSDVRLDADEQETYIFHSNGTGELTYHYDYDSSSSAKHQHYTIHFKYTYVDKDKSAVMCFYDSLERLEGDDESYNSTAWSSLVTVSKNVLMTISTTVGYIYWINEDYLEEIPNFRA